MGPTHKAKSTRAARGRSVNSSLKPRREPAAPKLSKLRTVADALRDFARAPAPRPADSPDISPTQAVREMRDGVPATELREIRRQLDLICSCVIVVRHALAEQNVVLDRDAALILQWHASDPLYVLGQRIDALLGNAPGDDQEEGRS
jgi:hypothetical protein